MPVVCAIRAAEWRCSRRHTGTGTGGVWDHRGEVEDDKASRPAPACDSSDLPACDSSDYSAYYSPSTTEGELGK